MESRVKIVEVSGRPARMLRTTNSKARPVELVAAEPPTTRSTTAAHSFDNENDDPVPGATYIARS
jgi:hypothetical protein